MDGTPPAYNLDPGSGTGSRSWIVNLEVSKYIYYHLKFLKHILKLKVLYMIHVVLISIR